MKATISCSYLLEGAHQVITTIKWESAQKHLLWSKYHLNWNHNSLKMQCACNINCWALFAFCILFKIIEKLLCQQLDIGELFVKDEI